ncbi:hypothetical protein DM02DRAFT_617108 [Periconia macrospinosa]|uniref:Uncharacterized protein n=1 Tax=Periconia macrospinosa TaxID=97972 RepID=A0A2V1DEU3_9PLEO|nr:hypothetical protein DM02DRAFT_617108 [Periconia macrospinosa]
MAVLRKRWICLPCLLSAVVGLKEPRSPDVVRSMIKKSSKQQFSMLANLRVKPPITGRL